MKTILALIAMASCLVAAQCDVKPVPIPSPETVDAGPDVPVLPAAGDRCSAAFTRIIAMDCGLPDTWIDACVTARSHGATFHLFCFDNARDCKAVDACMKEAG